MGGSIPVGGEKGDFRQDSNAVCLSAEGWGGDTAPQGVRENGTWLAAPQRGDRMGGVSVP